MRRTISIAGLLAVLTLASGCRFEPETPLSISAAAGRAGEVADLLSEGAEVDTVDTGGMTALGWAARSGQVASMEVLITGGARVDLPCGEDGWTPLMHAIHKHHDGAVLELLDAGASVDGRNGRKALLMAAGYGNAKLTQALLDAGVEPHDQMLTEAVGGRWDIDYRWTGCEPHTETVRALLEAAPQLRVPDDPWGWLAVRYARKQGCDEMLGLITAGGREGDVRASARTD